MHVEKSVLEYRMDVLSVEVRYRLTPPSRFRCHLSAYVSVLCGSRCIGDIVLGLRGALQEVHVVIPSPKSSLSYFIAFPGIACS